jgi:acyl-CoA thioesterase-2
MATPFVNLTPTHNPHRWYLPLEDSLCVGPPGRSFMFGGVGMAAAIQAMERTTERPVIWATAQYLSFARPPSVVDLDVTVPAHGHNTSQARVIGHVGDTEIFTVNAALGTRPSEVSHQWVEAPDVPGPDDCPPADHWRGDDGDLHSLIELRNVHGRYGQRRGGGRISDDGRLILWMRPRGDHIIDSSMLAIFADHVPSGIGAALGIDAGGNSLDNTIRIVNLVPTRWVLCDISIHAVHGGFGHGAMRLLSEDGRLMATASQSAIVRTHEQERHSNSSLRAAGGSVTGEGAPATDA